MISTSTLCFVLALSCSTYAYYMIQPDLLLDKISSKVAHDMALQVTEAADGLSTLELNKMLLDTMRSSLYRLAPELQELLVISSASSDVAKRLSVKINRNKELVDALTSRGKVAPRFFGALALGVAQVATDIVKMTLTRY